MGTFYEIEREIKRCKAAILKVRAANATGINREILLAQAKCFSLQLKK